jgi:xylulokinase
MNRASEPLVASVDVGTSGARATAFDLHGRALLEVRKSYAVHVPNPGWAEQDPRDWTRAAMDALASLARRTGPIKAIGLTGQCPTMAPFDRDIKPIGPAMLYRDNRAVDEARVIGEAFSAETMHRITGQLAEAFYGGPKVLWLRRHQPDVFARTKVFLQPRDVVLHELTGEVATDETHASCTLFFNLERRRWDGEILGALGLDPSLFPRALPPWMIAGTLTSAAAGAVGLPEDTPVVVGGADSLCLLYGAGVMDPGPVSENAGSSSTINSAVLKPVADLRVTNYSHVIPDRFATELGLNTAGAALAWAVKVLGYPSYEAFAADAASTRRRLRRKRGGAPTDSAPFFYPYLGDGERDNPRARGAFAGLSDRHDRAALAFAVAEGVVLTTRGLVKILSDAGTEMTELRVAGGGTRLEFLGPLKADAFARSVVHLDVDAASLGTAMLAARAVGFADQADAAIAEAVKRGRRFEPTQAGSEIEAQRGAEFERLRESPAILQAAAR